MCVYGGDEMLAGLTSCTRVKQTPSAITILSITNPTGQIPKLVHVYCADDSQAVTADGYAYECWYTPTDGVLLTTNGSTGVNASYSETPVQQTPTSVDTYYLSASTIELYKGNGSISSRWNTNTEYTIEIYI